MFSTSLRKLVSYPHSRYKQARLKVRCNLGNFSRAYLARLSRLDRHFVAQYHWKEDAPALLDAELSKLHFLSVEANDSIQDVLTRHGLFDSLPDESQYNMLFRSDEINFGMALDKKAPMDCLGRTGLHQALDAVATLETQYYQRRSTLLEQLETFISDEPLEHINQRDILGRTLLHVACEKGWTAGVRKLLAKGAEPNLKTAYGSTPLHYAAAGEHYDIVQMLLGRHSSEKSSLLDYRNNTALYYACKGTHTMLITLLLEYIHPRLGGTLETPVPLLKACISHRPAKSTNVD